MNQGTGPLRARHRGARAGARGWRRAGTTLEFRRPNRRENWERFGVDWRLQEDRQQVGLYAEAVARATGVPAPEVLLRV